MTNRPLITLHRVVMSTVHTLCSRQPVQTLKHAALAFLLFTGAWSVQAATITITANTLWSAITTGSGAGGQPAAGDTEAKETRGKLS